MRKGSSGDPPEACTYVLRKRAGQKRMTLSVHSSGRVTMTIPKWVSRREADRFFTEQRDWVAQARARLVVVDGPGREAEQAAYLSRKEEARRFVTMRLSVLNEQYGYAYNRIAIRRNVSRWGSCSARGNLNFDYRILFLPPSLQDYLLVHELCHLKELNHSPEFWALVARMVPDHELRRSELRRYKL